MLTISQEKLARITQAHPALRSGVNTTPALGGTVGDLWAYLQDSEAQLINIMSPGKQLPTDATGDPEWGGALYFLNQLPPEILDTLKRLSMPSSAITRQMMSDWESELENSGVVGSDGSLYATTKFAVLDPDWAYGVWEYVLHRTGVCSTAPFSDNGQLINLGDKTVSIALTGDWGTGTWTDGGRPACPALQVMQAMTAVKPDIGIHLGDVYYAGTEHLFADFGNGEEYDNFVSIWPTFPLGSFALNSNHEMYGGANGYFNVALKADKFKQQQGASYFALTCGNYVVIGLDTAYFDTTTMVMKGALSDDTQKDFLTGLDLSGKVVILLTHHNGLNAEGTKQTDLYKQVIGLFKPAPHFWYWGHVHNGIVYSDQCAAAESSIRARCVGHGSLPFGNAAGLKGSSGNLIPSVLTYTNTPLPDPDEQQKNRVLNGFAVLTLAPGCLTETFYDQTGAEVWSLPHAFNTLSSAAAVSSK